MQSSPSLPPIAQVVDEGVSYRWRPDQHDIRHLRLKAILLLVWATASFVACYFARDLQMIVFGHWPLGYWIASQGALLIFFLVVLVYALAMRRFERQDAHKAQQMPLDKHYPQEYG